MQPASAKASPFTSILRITPLPAPKTTPIGPFKLSTQPARGLKFYKNSIYYKVKLSK